MVVEFEDIGLQEIVETGKTTKKAYKKLCKDKAFIERLLLVISHMQRVESVSELAQFSWMCYEKLKYDYSGYSSVRPIRNRVERLIFTEHEGGIRIKLIELNQEHYGNKK